MNNNRNNNFDESSSSEEFENFIIPLQNYDAEHYNLVQNRDRKKLAKLNDLENLHETHLYNTRNWINDRSNNVIKYNYLNSLDSFLPTHEIPGVFNNFAHHKFKNLPLLMTSVENLIVIKYDAFFEDNNNLASNYNNMYKFDKNDSVEEKEIKLFKLSNVEINNYLEYETNYNYGIDNIAIMFNVFLHKTHTDDMLKYNFTPVLDVNPNIQYFTITFIVTIIKILISTQLNNSILSKLDKYEDESIVIKVYYGKNVDKIASILYYRYVPETEEIFIGTPNYIHDDTLLIFVFEAAVVFDNAANINK